MGDWAKHSTLNIGQVIRHLRYFFDLPDTPKLQAAKERAKFILNDLIYAVLPPQTHHTPEEVEAYMGKYDRDKVSLALVQLRKAALVEHRGRYWNVKVRLLSKGKKVVEELLLPLQEQVETKDTYPIPNNAQQLWNNAIRRYDRAMTTYTHSKT